jgi:hypothetical protein
MSWSRFFLVAETFPSKSEQSSILIAAFSLVGSIVSRTPIHYFLQVSEIMKKGTHREYRQ